MLVIDEDGVESLISELLKGTADNQVFTYSGELYVIELSNFISYSGIYSWSLEQALMRRGSTYLIGYFFKNSKLYLVDEVNDMLSTLIILLSDPDSATVVVKLDKRFSFGWLKYFIY